jgi:hypothetical protein
LELLNIPKRFLFITEQTNLNPEVRYGKKVLRTFDVDAKGEFSENFFQPTTPSDAA